MNTSKTSDNNASSDGELQECFPIPVFTKRINDYQQLNKTLVNEFYSYRDRDPREGSQWQRCDAYSSNINVLNEIGSPACRRLEQELAASTFKTVSTVNKEMWKTHNITSVQIHNSEWFQIYNNHGYHDVHVHAMSSWSGIYYVQTGFATNKFCDGRTRFYGPHVNSIYYEDAGNLYLRPSQYFDVSPVEGLLVIFPTYLPHHAIPYNGDKDRIVVAFTTQVAANS